MIRVSLAETETDATSIAWDAVDSAVMYRQARHAARPCDCPEGDCPSCCKDCGDPVTWVGPSQYDWEHTDD